MKKRIIAFLCVLALLLGTPIASVEAASANTYQVGFSKVDITPSLSTDGYDATATLGIPLSGYSDQNTRLAIGVLTPEVLKTSLEYEAAKSTEEDAIANFTAQAEALTGITDDDMYNLFVSCVAITDKADTTLLMLSLDVINCSDSLSSSLRKAITKATGVPDENITITSTHTHSGPDLSSTSYDQIEDLVAALKTKVVECADAAMADRSTATILQNTVEADGYNNVRHYYTTNGLKDDAGNRHVTGSNFGGSYGAAGKPIKDADNDMHLLMFDFVNASKTDLVLCNWRAHPCRDSLSAMASHSNKSGAYFYISSDYIGPMRAAVETAGYNFLFLQGAAGNIAAAVSSDVSTHRSSYSYGTELASYVVSGIAGMQKLDGGLIQTSRNDLTAGCVSSDPADVEYAQKIQAVYKDLLDGDNALSDEHDAWVRGIHYPSKTASGVELKSVYDYYTDRQSGGIEQIEAHNIANRLAWAYGLGSRYHANNIVANANLTGSDPLQLNAITMGDEIAFVTASNEIFDSYSEDLKDYYGTRTFVMGYTNGSNGYLPDEQAFKYNATEKDDGTYVYGGSYEVHTTNYAMGTGERLAQTLKNMLDEMRIRRYCPCVGTHTDSSLCKEVKWEPWTSTTTLPTSGNYYLTADITVSNSTELLGTLNLDLNGKTVKGSNGIFTMATGDHLVVTDSYTGGTLGVSGIPVVASMGSKLTVYAGTIGGTVKNNGANVNLWGKPSLYINMAKNAPAMKCEGLQTGSNIYVIGPLGLCFAKVSSADQKSCFTIQNDYSIHYENGGLYMTSKQVHCVCVGSLDGLDTDHVCDQVSWQPWVDENGAPITDSLPTTTGNYYLTANVYLTTEQDITDAATVRLDLNGMNVYASEKLDDTGTLVVNKGTRVYHISDGCTLEITSSATDGSGTISTYYNNQPADRYGYGGTIYGDSGSVLRLFRGTLRGTEVNSSSAPERGGCVYSNGLFEMYGGTIQDGRARIGTSTSGYGGCVYSNGTFNMYGGTIKSGIGTGFNVYLNNPCNAEIGGTATINGGFYLVGANTTLKLSGTPRLQDYSTYSGLHINANAAKVIDATELEAGAKIELSVAGNATNSVTRTIAKVSNVAQAACFSADTTASGQYGIHCDAEGNVALYDLTSGTRYGCVCNGKLADSDDHTCEVLTWQPWVDENGAPITNSLPTSGNWYLAANVAVTATAEVSDELNLDLHGRTVTATGSQRVLDVGSGETLRITDSRSGGAIDASDVAFNYDFTYANLIKTTDYCGGVIRVASGTLELYDGTLTGGKAVDDEGNGGHVVNGGVLYMTGTSGSRSTLKLYDGTLSGNAIMYGGGVYLTYTDFTMYGGTITDCSAGRGGSIRLDAHSKATIKDGTISDGTTSQYTYKNSSGTDVTGDAVGGNIHVAVNTAELTVEGGLITGGKALDKNGNGGNICLSGPTYIKGGTVTKGAAYHLGDNINVFNKLYVSAGEICDPAEGYNIGLWNGAEAILSGGRISGGAYGVYNGSKGGKTTLSGDVCITGYSSYGIYMNAPYENTGTTDNPVYTLKADNTLGTLTVEESFTGTASVYWGTVTAKALGIADAQEIENTVSNGYTGAGTLICDNADAPLVGSTGGKLILATVAIADGDGIQSYHPTFAAALAAYELKEGSADQSYIQLLTDLTDVSISESVYLDLNGLDMSVASVADGCSIYGMDSVTNQYTHYSIDCRNIIGKLTLADSIDAACIVKDVRIHLTKGTAKGTRKYLALEEDGTYTFHRYYLSLNEVGVRPADAGIFYNAVFYGDEAIAALVTGYGVEVSTVDTFAAGNTASSNYQTSLGAFQSGVLGNTGYRTVLKGILSKNGVTPVVDYSKENIYGRAYIEVDGIKLYCSDIGSTDLQSIIAAADTAYGKNGFSAAQMDALDTMYSRFSNIMESWGFLKNIGRIEIDIGDLFQTDPKEDDELNILLIGNSFSFYWVEELYELLAEGSGYDEDKITITNVYYSGCPLKNHWNWLETGAANYEIYVTSNGTRVGYKQIKLEDVITGSRAKSWDFISLQQNSSAFYSGSSVGDVDYARETLEPYLGNLLSYLRSKHPKAEYMWHQFWSHEIGHTSTNNIVTVENKTERTAFHNAMVSIGGEVSQLYDMTVVPTGEAWELVRDNTLFTTPHTSSTLTSQTLCTRIRNGELYDDLYHDGDVGGGQYLNACVWYEKITGKSVVGSTYRPKYTLNETDYSLSEEQIGLLQYAAHAAVAKYTPNSDPSLDNETNILLIGNSFSYWWTDELAGMLEAAGYPNVSVFNVYTSGCKLQQHWTGYQNKLIGFDNNGNGSLDSDKDEIIQFRRNGVLQIEGTTLFDCITEKNWDVISLQQSGSYVYGSGSLDKFRNSMEPYASYLLSTLRGMFPQAEYYWLQNWAHEIGTDTDVANLAERQQIANIFRVGAKEICAKYSLTNVPCGDAWELVRDDPLINYVQDGVAYNLTSRARNTVAIYTDGKHDGDYCGGQYLNACVWFETITGTSCIGNSFRPSYDWRGTISYLSDAQVELLQHGAHDAVAAAHGADYAK